MELIGSLLLISAVAFIVGLFVLQPFIRLQASKRQDLVVRLAEKKYDHERSSLLAEQDRVIVALRDLDFDNLLGKVPTEDYQTQRADLLKIGTETIRRLRELDSIIEKTAASGLLEESQNVNVSSIDTDHQANISPHDHQKELPVTLDNHEVIDEVEELIASRKRERKESAAGFCPHCGRPVQKSDKFCSRCGSTI